MAETLQSLGHDSTDLCLISESGISNPETVSRLRANGFRGFLMGEHFMKSDAPGDTLAAFLSDILFTIGR